MFSRRRQRLLRGDSQATATGSIQVARSPDSPNQLLRLHRSVGNRAVGQFLQAKLNPVQISGASPGPMIQRSPFPQGTNYRFDTYAITESDLHDKDIIARLESLPVELLRNYRDRNLDPGVRLYLGRLIAIKEDADLERQRPDYLKKVQAAVTQIGEPGTAAETLSDVLSPLLKQLSKEVNVTWRSQYGAEHRGKGFSFKPPGKGSKKLKLTLVLDEANPEREKRAGYFNSANGEIVLIVRRLPTVDEIRETLFHESLHMAIDVLETQGGAALGPPKDKAIAAIQTDLSRTKDQENLKRTLTNFQKSLNDTRRARNAPELTQEDIDRTTKGLWEEMVVRAETFYFELQYWGQSQSTGGSPPTPNYLMIDGLRDTYLNQAYRFINDADIANLSEEQKSILMQLFNFLRYAMRSMIKARGVSNLYAPSPFEPKTSFLIKERSFEDPGPIVPLESLQPDFLKETVESVKEPGF